MVRRILNGTSTPLPKLNYDNTLLMRLIIQNNITAFIASNIHLFDELEELKPLLIKRAKKSLSKNLLLQSDLLKVIDLANEHNIPIILFKGHPVNEMIYGNNHERTSTDIDILIDVTNIEKLETLLLERNYVIDRPTFEMDPKEMEVFLTVDNEKSYFSPAKSKLDVHFKLFKNKYLIIPPNDDEISESFFFNRSILRFNNSYTLLYLMVHGKIHYWEKMMWLIDIAKLIQKMSIEELEAGFALAQKNKLENIFLGTLSLCNVIFESEIPEAFSNKIGNKQAHYVMLALTSLAGKPNSKVSKWKQRVSMKPDLRYFFCQISLFPVRDMNIIKIPFAKRIFYPLLRPITYLMS